MVPSSHSPTHVGPPPPQVAIITGPTASGKSDLALQYCLRHRAWLQSSARPPDNGIEIINADSLQVYQGFDLGTAKPTLEERQQVPHHLIDVSPPEETFTAADFVRRTTQCVTELQAQGKRAILVGGSGFYLRALLFGLWDLSSDPAAMPDREGDQLKDIRSKLDRLSTQDLYDRLREVDSISALKIGSSDRYRLLRAMVVYETTAQKPSALERKARAQPPNPMYSIAIVERETEELFARVRTRAQKMLAQGFVQEVTALKAQHPHSRALASVGYAQVVQFLSGQTPAGRKPMISQEDLLEEICLATRQLIKSQRTWNKSQFRDTPKKTFVLTGATPDWTEAFAWLDLIYRGEPHARV